MDQKASLGHDYLGYREFEIHFIYAFLWKTSIPIDLRVFASGFPAGAETNGWLSPLIHERLVGGELRDFAGQNLWVCSYQPTFVLERRCLELSGSLSVGRETSVWLVVPKESGASLPRKGQHLGKPARGQSLTTCPVDVTWTIRVFDFGCGTCTVRVVLRDLEQLSPGERFSCVHWALRLAPNMDVSAESHMVDVSGIDRNLPVADTFLYTTEQGCFRLFDYMSKTRDEGLALMPGTFFSRSRTSTPTFYNDSGGLAYEAGRIGRSRLRNFRKYHPSDWNENQAPFTFCVSVLSEADLGRLAQGPVLTVREVGSVLAKLTLDNRDHEKFSEMTDGYFAQSVGLRIGSLKNWSHDRRMFFSFTRRGAVAFVAQPNDIPALFVVPSLLNLFELLRARVFSGIIVGCRLARMAETLSRLDPVGDESPDLVEYARLRTLVVQNLQNPLEYLFDGGSATDLAVSAEDILFAKDAWENVRRSFDLVDRLMADWDAADFRIKYGE